MEMLSNLAFTITFAVALYSPNLAVIVAVPIPLAVTVPFDTETQLLSLSQVIVFVSVVSSADTSLINVATKS